MARAPFPIVASGRVNTALASLRAATKTRWIGRARATPAATSITAPSRMNAVLSAIAVSGVGERGPIGVRRRLSPASSAEVIERMLSPGSISERSESSGTKLPSTNTIRRASMDARSAADSAAQRLAAASGRGASGLASRISARKSVYFHSSMRRLGRPPASKRRNASSRSAATPSAPGKLALAAAKFTASAVSAAVLMGRTSAFIAPSRRLVPILGVAGCLQLEGELFSAGLHDATLRKHMHHIRDDVVEQALIMGDDHEAALRCAQGVHPFGNDFERIDIEARISLVQHAKPRLQHCHLQDLVALLLAAGESDVDRAAQHVLIDAKPARDLAHPPEEVGGGKLGFPTLPALRIDGSAQEGHAGNAGDFKGILKRQKQPLGCALVRRNAQDVVAVEQYLSLRNPVVRLSGKHVGKRRLARSVRPHDRMHGALSD